MGTCGQNVRLRLTFRLSRQRGSKKKNDKSCWKVHFVCVWGNKVCQISIFYGIYIIRLNCLESSAVPILVDFPTIWHGPNGKLHASSTNGFRRNPPIFVCRWRKLNPRRAQTILIELRRDVPEKCAIKLRLAVCRRISCPSGGAAAGPVGDSEPRGSHEGWTGVPSNNNK